MRSGSLFSYVSIEKRILTLDRLNPSCCELYASEGPHRCRRSDCCW
ncbi:MULTISPECIES: hypothetical protein [unclassified Synechococcus]|nr:MULTISPECIES: hypothetical protein [unclassified Synechococcus]WFN60635.1 hypothetical protein N4320_10145 [Synechococcus sp. CCFWC 502]